MSLSTTSLTKRFGRTDALNDVSISIPAGSSTALVGPNGAGKSTLMKLAMGFEQQTSGAITVLGHDPVSERGAVLPHIAYFPQSPATYRELTVGEHLDVAAHYRRGFDRVRASERLRSLRIPLSTRASGLSGGQLAQLSLALALGLNSKLLLLDEPLASLDPLSRSDFLAELVIHRRETGATVILSSHILGDIARASDRLVVLAAGRVLVQGNLDDLLQGHFVSDDPQPLAHPIAELANESGPVRRVWAGRPNGGTGSPTLEEIVLAYLTASRDSASVQS